MQSFPKRAFARENCETPIIFSTCGIDKLYDAIMYNNSTGGLYFESGHGLRPGAGIFVKVPEAYLTDDFAESRAEIMWARKTVAGAFFGMGARYIFNECNLCSNLIPPREMHVTEQYVCLCESCYQMLGGLPEGNVKSGIENYILGNVL